MTSRPVRRAAVLLLALPALALAAPAALPAQETGERLELDAVRERLDEARAAHVTARRSNAAQRAPRSWGRAGTLLSRAERAMSRAVVEEGGAGGADTVADPGALATAAARADSARAFFRRAARLAAAADTVRSRAGAFERAALAYEDAVARVADSLGVGPGPGAGVDARLDAILAAMARREDTAAALRARVDSARLEAREAARRADSLADRVASLEERLDSVGARLRRRLARERRIREVRGLFEGEEASVVVAGDTVELRLTGFAFEAGESELPADAGPLLTRVRSAIRAFPRAEIVVEGHTDARGDEARNRALSQERAIAVRDHLLLHLSISADRLSAVGRGETRPVASNDTEAGRRRNRRIEVMLVLPPVNGAARGETAPDESGTDAGGPPRPALGTAGSGPGATAPGPVLADS